MENKVTGRERAKEEAEILWNCNIEFVYQKPGLCDLYMYRNASELIRFTFREPLHIEDAKTMQRKMV